MLTRSRAQLLKPSIRSIPLELFEFIMDQVDYPSLARCARVSRAWTEPALVQMYSYLEISGKTQTIAVEQSPGLRRYRRRSLRLELIFHEWEEVMSIVEQSRGVESLYFDECLYVPIEIFGLPSLQALKRLRFCGVSFRCTPDHPLTSVPFRLQQLQTAASLRRTPSLQKILDASLSKGVTSITFLILATNVLDNKGRAPSTLFMLKPFASTFSTLVLPGVVFDEDDDPFEAWEYLRTAFLPSATSLSVLSISFSHYCRSSVISPCLSAILSAVNSPSFKTLNISIPEDAVTKEIFATLQKGLEDWTGLSNLSTIKFSSTVLRKMEQLKGLSEFRKAAKEKGVMVVCGTKRKYGLSDEDAHYVL